MDTLQIIDGTLVPAQDNCIAHAKEVYRERKGIDTDPQVVRMILRGEPIDHWYYRSQEWVDQPFAKPSLLLQAHVGPARSALPCFYGPGKYIVDEDITEMLRSEE